MDLKLKEVAELLNVSERTIQRWLNDGKIPSYRINEQYLFSRIEIEDWVMKNKPSHIEEIDSPVESKSFFPKSITKRPPAGRKQFSLYRAIHIGGVFNPIPGDDKETIIASTLQQMAKPLGLDAEVLTDLFLDREHLMPTALNHGIAVPHTRDFLLDSHQDVVAVAFPEKPIPYGALDGLPVHTLFFIFASEDKSHLHLLAKIAHICTQEPFLNLLQQRPSKTAILEYVKEWEQNIP